MIHILLSVLLVFTVTSCSDVKIGISEVYPELVYDYSNEQEEPAVSLSVFCEISSGETRILSMKVTDTTTEMYWTTDDVLLLRDKSTKKDYAGWSSFSMPASKTFSKGTYRAEYEDFAGETYSVLFTVNQQDADSYAPQALRNGTRQILLINQDGSIAYAGVRDDNFQSAETILKKYKNAFYYREYVLNTDVKAVYLMPAVYLK